MDADDVSALTFITCALDDVGLTVGSGI